MTRRQKFFAGFFITILIVTFAAIIVAVVSLAIYNFGLTAGLIVGVVILATVVGFANSQEEDDG